MENEKIRLTQQEKALLILLSIFVLSSVFWIPVLFGIAFGAAENAAVFIGSVSISISTYAVLSANRLKKYEMQRAQNSARAMVAVDVSEVLKEVKNILIQIDGEKKIEEDRDRWNDLIVTISELYDRYKRKQDQLPWLCTQFDGSDFLNVQAIYMSILRVFQQSEKYVLPNNIDSKTEEDIIKSKRNVLKDKLILASEDLEENFHKLNIENFHLIEKSSLKKT